jgi:hypothetical protein
MALSDASDSPVAGQLRVAQEALEEANRRREVARQAVIDFALRAVVDGHDVEGIMDACGFRENENGPAETIFSLFGLGGYGTRRQRFAAWLGAELTQRLSEEPVEPGS